MTRLKIWSAGRLLALLPVLFSMLLESAQSKVLTPHDPTAALKCLLRNERPCVKTTGYTLPSRFLQMYTNMSEEMKEIILLGKPEAFAKFEPQEFAKIPVPLLFMTPSSNLNQVSGSSLASVITRYPTDAAVAIKMTEVLNLYKFQDFFKKLEKIELATRTQDEIAKVLVKCFPHSNNSWNFHRFRMIEKVGDPLLAHLPPSFMANLANSDATKFLFHLRNWLWSNMPTDAWNGKSQASKRGWSDMMIRSSYPSKLSDWTENEGRRFRFLLEGATFDELSRLTAKQLKDTNLFKTSLEKLQIRALFDIVYSREQLTTANLTEKLLPVALLLSPENLQKFSFNSTNFKLLIPLFQKQTKFCSYATAKQVLELLIAQSVLTGKLESVKPETWGNGIENVGKFIYVLPVNGLESYRLSPPSALVQSRIDSEKLSASQARLLTGERFTIRKPDLMLGHQGLLRAISSSQLAATRTLPQSLLFHLLANLPSGMPVQSAILLQKVGSLIGDQKTLEKIMSNKNRNQFFEMLPSRTVVKIFKNLENLKGFEDSIRRLPQNTLSTLLTDRRSKLSQQNDLWTSDILLSPPAEASLLGLTCNDIHAMDTVDFIYIMGHYNAARKNVDKFFPKDLQYCCQKILINYLKMKASIQDGEISKEILDYLELAEIEAVGGYILGTLPIENIKKSIFRKQILEAIGQLPLPELLVATKESNVYKYAQLLLDQFAQPYQNITAINAMELFSLGNLVHFLSDVDVTKINSTFLKLFLESLDDSKSKMVCADTASRSAWYQVIVKSFGVSSVWTAGTLATLGDMLIVVPHEDLNLVPKESWKIAADALLEQTSYNTKVEWPGKINHVPFYQACAEILGEAQASDYIAAVRGLARWYLAAVQSQLDTVVTASHLIELVQRSKLKTERKLVVPDFPMEAAPPGTIIQVLEADEIEEPIRRKKPETSLQNIGGEEEITSEETTEELNELTVYTESLTSTGISEYTSTTTSSKSETNYSILITEAPFEIVSKITLEAIGPTRTSTESLFPELTTSINSPETSAVSVYKKKFNSSIETSIGTSVRTESTTLKSTYSNELYNNDDNYIVSTKDILTRIGMKATTNMNRNLDNLKNKQVKPVNSDSIQQQTTSPIYSISVSANMGSTEGSSQTTVSFTEFDNLPDTSTNSDIPENTLIKSSSNAVQEKGISFNESREKDLHSSVGSNFEKMRPKRHTALREKSDHKIHRNIEHSGEVLREVVNKNYLFPEKTASTASTVDPETVEITQHSAKKNSTRYWQKVSCDAIRAASETAGLALTVTDIELMEPKELEKCVDILGSLELETEVQIKIWNIINKDKWLKRLPDLGNLVQVLDSHEISRIDFNLSMKHALDNVAVLSTITDTHKLHEVGLHFVRSNPDINMTIETVVALGRILCEVLTISSRKLSDVFEESTILNASPVLGKIQDCHTHCLHKLSHLATLPSEYGSLNTWTAEDIATLGVIPAGLKAEQWRELKSTGYGNDPLLGLKPSAIKCIPPQIFKELDENQLKSLSTLSTSVISKEQMSHLSDSQLKALVRIQKEVPSLKHLAADISNAAIIKNLNLLVILTLSVISRFTV